MKWYADDSDMKTIKELKVPNMVLFGGIAVSQDNERLLREAIEKAKGKYGHPRNPIKWNFKDLKSKYEEQGRLQSYQDLMDNMFHVRREIVDSVLDIEFSIIISAVLGYSSEKKVLVDLKSDLSRHVFSNGLMRFSQHFKECGAKDGGVVLDWPDGGLSKPFDVEYAFAYSGGVSKDRIKYISGSLQSLGFNDSISYTRMPHSTLMQFSDMVVGMTREFMQHSLDETKNGHGVKLLGSIANKFRGYPNRVIGRGISVNTKATATRSAISAKFHELYVDI